MFYLRWKEDVDSVEFIPFSTGATRPISAHRICIFVGFVGAVVWKGSVFPLGLWKVAQLGKGASARQQAGDGHIVIDVRATAGDREGSQPGRSTVQWTGAC